MQGKAWRQPAPAAPLATYVQRHARTSTACVRRPASATSLSPSAECCPNPIPSISQQKIGCSGNVRWRIEKVISYWSSTATVLPVLKTWRKIGRADGGMICLTEIIVKNKSETQAKHSPISPPWYTAPWYTATRLCMMHLAHARRYY